MSRQDDIQQANRAVVEGLRAKQQPPSRWLRLTRRGAISLAMIAFGGWIGTQIWPHWIAFRDRQPPKTDAPALTQPAVVAAPAPDVSTSLLGTDASTSEEPLQLFLVGTTVGRTLQESTAMLGTDPRNPQTYAGGGTIANGARIDEIKADHIVLSLAGRRATLKVDRDAPARLAMTTVVNDQRTEAGHPILTPTRIVGAIGPTTIGGRRDAASRIDRQPSVMADLSDVVRAQPVFKNDRFAGFQLFPGSTPSRFAALGVEEGDVIRSIEGKFIESDAAWQQIDEALQSGASIVVGIERNGALMSVSLDGARLVNAGASAGAMDDGPAMPMPEPPQNL